jgi:hypothetical protein
MAQTCTNQWSNMFPGGYLNGNVGAFAVLDGELYVGGRFDACMGRSTANVAKWDGHRWSPMGAARLPTETVNALIVFEDPNPGDGPAVYAAGVPGVGVKKWHYAEAQSRWQWDQVAGVSEDGTVYTLAVYDGMLYAGGAFSTIAGQSAKRLARCGGTGTSWEEVGGGIDPNAPGAIVLALAVLDDTIGEALFVGGKFTTAGGVSAASLTRSGSSAPRTSPGGTGASGRRWATG